MDNQTLRRLGSLSERLYCLDITYFVIFTKTFVKIESDSFTVSLIYKKNRSSMNFTYTLVDRYNESTEGFNDFRLLRSAFYELVHRN